jgi:hypothetical protein
VDIFSGQETNFLDPEALKIIGLCLVVCGAFGIVKCISLLLIDIFPGSDDDYDI